MKINKYLILILLFTIALLIPALINPLNYIAEDSYFYLKVAQNIAAGNGSTFNQVTETNGFHPLWMLCCVFVSLFSNGDKLLFLREIFVFQTLISLFVVLLFIRINDILKIKSYLPGLFFLLIYFIIFYMLGSEASINGLFQMLCLYYYFKHQNSFNNLQSLIFGILLGLLFLSRLDNIFIVFIYVLIFIYYNFNQNNGYYKKLILIIFGFLIPAIPYLLFNYINYEHFVPISGAIKSTFPFINADLHSLRKTGAFYGFFGFATFIWAIIFESNKLYKEILIITSLSIITLLVYVFLWTDNHTTWNWYYVSGAINLALFSSILLEKIYIGYRFKNLINYLTILIVLYGVTFNIATYLNPFLPGYLPFPVNSKNTCFWQIEAAKKLDVMFPENTIILTLDWPGMIGFWSNMRIVPVDGLISDYKYQEFIKENGILEFIKKNKINYIIAPDYNLKKNHIGFETDYLSEFEMEIKIYSKLYDVFTGKIILKKENQLINFKKLIKCDQSDNFAIWKLDL